MKVALYARVSTSDKGQDPQNQLRPMRERCQQEAWVITKEYVDMESGRDFERAALQEMLEDAKHHKFDCIYFWSLDRFSRAGVFPTIKLLNELKDYGVKYLSHQESFINSVGGFGDVLVSLFCWMAQEESKHHGDRVRAGIAVAKVKGTRSGVAIGRPSKLKALDSCRELRAGGLSLRAISAQTGVSYGTVRNLLLKNHSENAPSEKVAEKA